jgi:peptidyl-prolyl cis-trans isomerase C
MPDGLRPGHDGWTFFRGNDMQYFNAKVIWLSAALLLSAGAASAQNNIATVGKKPLTAAEYKAAAGSLGDRPDLLLSNPHLKRRFLDDLINNGLLADAALKEKLDQSQEYQDYLKVTREQILARLFMKKYLAEAMNDKAVATWFEGEKLNFSNREALVKHIIVKDEAQAKKALVELQKNPADFDKLLEKYAGSNPAGQKGGSMGFVGRGRLIGELEDAVFATNKGSVHPKVIKTSFGWHVVLVSDFRGTDDVKLADVRDKVLEQMEHKLRAALIKKHRDQAGVTVDDNALRNVRFE